MNIYDCFMYYDEDLLLDIRLNSLDKFVKKFVDIKTPKDSIVGDTVFYLSRGKNELVNFKPQSLWYDYKPANIPGQEGELRSGIWNPQDLSLIHI